MSISFESVTVPTVTRGATKENPFLDAVKNLPVVSPEDKERPGLRFTVPLDGVTRAVGAKKGRDGKEIPEEDRRREDEAVLRTRRDLDSAGDAVSVTVRKLVELVALDDKGERVTRKNTKNTHAVFTIYATAKQVRKQEEPAAVSEDVPAQD